MKQNERLTAELATNTKLGLHLTTHKATLDNGYRMTTINTNTNVVKYFHEILEGCCLATIKQNSPSCETLMHAITLYAWRLWTRILEIYIGDSEIRLLQYVYTLGLKRKEPWWSCRVHP